MSRPAILLVGTADTKSDELGFLRDRLGALGADVWLMDVGVLGRGAVPVDITHTEVAAAAGYQLADVIRLGDENLAMQVMADGAARLATRWQAEGRVQGLLALGGTMGTDLALQVAAALPQGLPKVIVSTVAYSPLIAPERLTPDLIMVAWPGGLHGLNALCRAALAHGAGAVVGVAEAALSPQPERPLIGKTSLGKSCLSYKVRLKPALEARGYEVAVFHTTGMGGRAFESMAADGRFAAVMDFSLQELANLLGGSGVSAGADRLTGAGRSGTPQIVAPGAVDMIDYPSWRPVPAALAGRPVHVHNRLIASGTSAPALRRCTAGEVATRLAQAKGPTCLLLPTGGLQAWDRPGQPLHDAEGLQAFNQAMRAAAPPGLDLRVLDTHIKDDAFTTMALGVFDAWVSEGRVVSGRP